MLFQPGSNLRLSGIPSDAMTQNFQPTGEQAYCLVLLLLCKGTSLDREAVFLVESVGLNSDLIFGK